MLISLFIIVGVFLMLAGVVLMAFVRLIPTKKDVASLPKRDGYELSQSSAARMRPPLG
jgi:hypothetical protein